MSSADASQNLGPSGLDENAVVNGDSAPEQHEHGVIERADLLRIALVIAVAGVVWFFPRLGWLGIGGVLIGGFPIFVEAYENLRERRMTMELSMTLALLAALVIR
jgi:cation transport ATPase